jgi:hypothetical protein
LVLLCIFTNPVRTDYCVAHEETCSRNVKT